MTWKPVEVQVPITELATLVEKKSKQMDLNDTPKLMSLPINDLPYARVIYLGVFSAGYLWVDLWYKDQNSPFQ